jgi:hypothetical protein
MVEGSPTSPHVIKMMGYLESLDKLCCEPKDDLVTDVILQLLPVSYEPFIMNFHMNGIGKIVVELHGMLKTTEDSIQKNANHVMMIQKEKNRGNIRCLPRAKAKERVLMSPQALSLRQKASLALSLMRNVCTATRRDIGSEEEEEGEGEGEVRLPL